MNIRIKRVAPLQAGKVLAALYALLSVVLVPIMLIAALASPEGSGPPVILAILFPLLYIVMGFVSGVVGSFLYNLVAKWFGGFEVSFDEEVG